MKLQKSPVIWAALLLAFVIILSGSLLPPSSAPPKLASCFLLGYTNRTGTNMVLLQVTNHTGYRLVCFVSPPMVAPARPGEVILADNYPAANPVFLSPHEPFTFLIRCPTDTNLLYVRFDFQQTQLGWPRWKRRLLSFWRSAGLPFFKPKMSFLESPAFGKDEQ